MINTRDHQMPPFEWKPLRADLLRGQAGNLQVDCLPINGLMLHAGDMKCGPVLGLEVVDAVHLGPQPLVTPNTHPDVIVRQDTLVVHYAPTTKRPVECQARWRVLPEGIFDLEVSTLTPGNWVGLAVQTRSTFQWTESAKNELWVDDSVKPGLVIYRPVGSQVSYAEFCHPDDGYELHLHTEGQQVTARFRLFGHDLEKGVILRGRLRGILVPRATDAAAARAAYDRFLVETPNLT